jgi:hypothetical protein
MPRQTEFPDKGLSEQQLDDFDVDRQRERLERSRPQQGNQQSDEQGGARQSGEQAPQQRKP